MSVYQRAAWSFALGTAAVIGGTWLYVTYGPRKHRKPAALAAGLVLGQQVGAVAGLALAGPAGFLPGSAVGAIAGAVLGTDLAAEEPT